MRRRAVLTLSALALGVAPALVVPDGAGATLTRVFENTYAGQNWRSSPTVADIDGDGVNDIVVGDRVGVVHAVRADGSDLPGWPQQVNIAGTNTGIEATPAVGDLDGDGANEVVVGAGVLGNGSQNGGLIVYNRDGSRRCTLQTRDRVEGPNGFSDAVFGSPAIGDVTGDGRNDIVFGSFDHDVYVLNSSCGIQATFFNNDTIFSSPALVDLDFDGRMEILIGADSSGTFAPNGGIMRLIEFQGTALVQRWQFNIGDIVQSSPAVGEIDGDANPEVVFGGGDFWGHPDGSKVYALNAENGSLVPGFPVTLGGRTISSPALGDLNGDGSNDIAIATFNRDGGPNRLNAISHNGGVMWSVNPADGTPFTQGEMTSGPVIADADGDGANEVIIPAGNAGFIRRGSDGALVDTFDEQRQHITSAAVAQFGSEWRIVAAGFLESADRNYLSSHKIPPPGTTPPWPQFGRSADNRAHLPKGAPTGKGGYYVLDDQGDVYAFGTARHFGSVPILKFHGTPIGGAASAAISGTSDGGGYYQLDSKGGMFTFGNARFFGSVPGLQAAGVSVGAAPSIALAVTADNGGYFVLDGVGGMFTFGNARFFGSVPGLKAAGVPIGSAPSIALAVTGDNGGYWVLDGVGGMFSFGNAEFFGSVPGLRASGTPVGPARVVGMAPTAAGRGYWMVDEDGGMFAFGDAPYFGSIPELRGRGVGIGPAKIIGMVPTPSGQGYLLFDDKGGIFAFGDGVFVGSLPGVGVNTTAISVTPYRGP